MGGAGLAEGEDMRVFRLFFSFLLAWFEAEEGLLRVESIPMASGPRASSVGLIRSVRAG